ncbi:hypothetical protein DMN91_008708 [Ooceraea biroi]|uniref:Uncharacterized protein n=1 Tax=Ooceraea biroi TaxID=2015173 RepID=A0A3L8DDF3_OOCBI|nr:hypothetical protein DMN91_008708 [Ooceraea biroi]
MTSNVVTRIAWSAMPMVTFNGVAFRRFDGNVAPSNGTQMENVGARSMKPWSRSRTSSWLGNDDDTTMTTTTNHGRFPQVLKKMDILFPYLHFADPVLVKFSTRMPAEMSVFYSRDEIKIRLPQLFS